jgi:hypothetical protein
MDCMTLMLYEFLGLMSIYDYAYCYVYLIIIHG